MRRHVLSRLDDLDLDARELAMAAARRAGLSLDEWAVAVLAASEERPAPPRPAPRRTSDLDALIARMTPPSRPQPRQDYDILMAAVAAEGERQARDQSSRTAIALESMASWIEQAEVRLNEAARTSADQRDRIAAVLSETLSSLKDRLDAVERSIAAEQAPPRLEFPMEEAIKALAPVSDTLAGLRADMSRLATRLERPDPALAPAVETIRGEIDSLRSGMDQLATRTDILAIDAALGSIAKELGQGPTTKDLRTLASSITVLYEQIQCLSDEVSEGLHRRIGRDIDLLKGKIDALAASGVDRSVIDFLSGQIVDIRQDLANRAEPHQIGRLSEEIESLGRQIVDLRLSQASKDDFQALKTSLDDVCSALSVTVAAQEASRVPEQLERLDQRLDLLAARPEPKPVDLSPITDQLALLTDRMATLSAPRDGNGDAMAEMMERLSSRFETAAMRAAPSHEPLLERFDRIEEELRQLGERTETGGIAQMLRALGEKMDRTPQKAGFDTLERQVRDLAGRLDRIPGESLQKVLGETASQLQGLQSEASGIAERAAKAVLDGIRPALPDAGDLDALKHGVVELKALHSRTDRKTQETLRAVHDALEALVSRLANPVVPPPGGSAPEPEPKLLLPADRLEAAVRRLHAATLSQIEEIAPPGTLGASVSAMPAGTAAPEAVRNHVRSTLIAAARRAAHATAPEPAVAETPAPMAQEIVQPDTPEPADTAAPEPASASLFERLRRSFDSNRRPLLFGLAFLVLAIGAAQILSSERKDLALAAQANGGQQEMVQAAEAKPAETASLAAPDNAGLFQAVSLASETPAPVPLAAGKFRVDPATVGEIPAEAPASLRVSALSGDAAALYAIAVRAAEGRGMAQDMTLAARLFERAAQAGLPAAQERLAMMHEKGVGVTRDLRQAAFWYERAALGGHVRAMHNLATLLASGSGGKPDYAAALRWYTEAAESGFRDSQFNAGLLLARGIGAKPDLSRAYHWFSLAAAQGDAEAVRKSEEIAGRISASELKALKSGLDLWRPRAIDPVANEAPFSAEGQTAALDHLPGNRS